MIETGDILLVGNKKTLLAKLIMRFTRSNWHHAEVCIIIDDIAFTCGANITGITLTPLRDWYNKDVDLCIGKPIERLGKLEKTTVKSICLHKVGRTRYDYEAILFTQPYRWVLKRFGKDIKVKKDNNYTCGEFVGMIYNTIRGYYPNYSRIAPVELITNSFTFTEEIIN
ncbi:MAG: hypothetical protein QNK20_16545 [Aureibaculum sp.]|nr:hypothetical protein [Aureibaculum sp.]